jgi:hypothetical protein
MEPNSLAEELPALYRAILDRVAELEADGHRIEAARMRSSATQIYSRAWDEKARRRLEGLLLRNARPAAGLQVRHRGGFRFRGRRSGPRSAVIS